MNIVAETYSRVLASLVGASISVRNADGKPTGGFVPFGYARDGREIAASARAITAKALWPPCNDPESGAAARNPRDHHECDFCAWPLGIHPKKVEENDDDE